MKTLLFFTDTETTGFSEDKDQVLAYSIVMCDKDETIMEKEIKIRLKKNVFPDAGALLVNNINPFDDSHNKDAMSEYEGAHALTQTILDYHSKGYRVVLVAYNAAFDKKMYQAMFERSGIDFNLVFTNVFDPLPVAKALIKEKTLKTREIKTGFGNKSYESAKLTDVYSALGYSTAGIQAHNALEDTKMLRTATFKLYYLFTNKSLDEAGFDPNEFNEGDLKTIIYNDDIEFVKKTVKILKKPNDNNSVLVLDYDLFKEKPDKIKAMTREIKLHDIFDELDPDYHSVQSLERYYNENQLAFQEIADTHKFKEEVQKEGFEKEGFEKVEKLAEKLLNDPKAELSSEEKALEPMAEEYAYARFNEGWKVKLHGQNHENEIKKLTVSDSVCIGCDPEGFFRLYEDENLILSSEKKGEIVDRLKEMQLIETGTPLYKEVSNFLVAVKNFKNEKHPSRIIKEFNLKKNEVFNGANPYHKETFRGLVKHYQTYNKEAFKELTIPDFKLNLNIFKRPAGK